MNKKTSSITVSILIMLVVLAVLLSLTAFFVDQAVIFPLVLMKDTDVNLRCFLSLKNFNTGYVRQTQILPNGSLRQKLESTYNLTKESSSITMDDSLISLGYSGIFSGNEESFRAMLTDDRYVVTCYTRSFGPVYNGFIALYRVND